MNTTIPEVCVCSLVCGNCIPHLLCANVWLSSLSLISSLPQFLLSWYKMTWSLVKSAEGWGTAEMWLEFRVASLLKHWPKQLMFLGGMELRKSQIFWQVSRHSPSSMYLWCVVQWGLVVRATWRYPSLCLSRTRAMLGHSECVPEPYCLPTWPPKALAYTH